MPGEQHSGTARSTDAESKGVVECASASGAQPMHEIAGGTTGRNEAETLSLRNSIIHLQSGPAGVIARIEWPADFQHEYAGPIPGPTVDALREVQS